MTNEEAMKELDVLKWKYAEELNDAEQHYEIQRAIDLNKKYNAIKKALEAVGKSDKYRWHDLRKNPLDLPEIGNVNEYGKWSRDVLVYGSNFNGFSWSVTAFCYEVDGENTMEWCNAYDTSDDELKEIIAWREIETFEEEE